MLDLDQIQKDFPELEVYKDQSLIKMYCDDVDLLTIYPRSNGLYRVISLTQPVGGFYETCRIAYQQDMAETPVLAFLKKHYDGLVKVKNFFENQYDLKNAEDEILSYGFERADGFYLWDVSYTIEVEEDNWLNVTPPQIWETGYDLGYHLSMFSANINYTADSLSDLLTWLGEEANE